VVTKLARLWGNAASWELDGARHAHEAAYLKLDCSKAASRLHWRPAVDLDQTLQLSVDWYRSALNRQDMHAVTLAQIEDFLSRTAPPS
jgi:CDP-glucose 4,6-dehydratase